MLYLGVNNVDNIGIMTAKNRRRVGQIILKYLNRYSDRDIEHAHNTVDMHITFHLGYTLLFQYNDSDD